MKFVMALLFLVLVCSAFAFTDYACSFLEIDPSGINRALGWDGIGVTNVWHKNALLSYNNPALSSFQDGISYGSIHDNWFKGSYSEPVYYDAGLINIGYKGIGLLLSAPNLEGKQGIHFDFGLPRYMTKDGKNSSKSYQHEYESADVYGVSANVMQVAREICHSNDFCPEWDVSIGVNHKYIKSMFYTYDAEHGIYGYVKDLHKGQSTDLGAVVKYQTKLADDKTLDAVYGLKFSNVTNNRIIQFEDSNPIYRNVSHGLAMGITIPLHSNNYELMFIRPSAKDNQLTARLLSSYAKQIDNENPAYSLGTELGVFNTVYFRLGRYESPKNTMTGMSYGFGINLHYKDIISYTFNYADFPGGVAADRQTSTDHNFNINFMEVYKELKH